jgi:hypothetical protein
MNRATRRARRVNRQAYHQTKQAIATGNRVAIDRVKAYRRRNQRQARKLFGTWEQFTLDAIHALRASWRYDSRFEHTITRGDRPHILPFMLELAQGDAELAGYLADCLIHAALVIPTGNTMVPIAVIEIAEDN